MNYVMLYQNGFMNAKIDSLVAVALLVSILTVSVIAVWWLNR